MELYANKDNCCGCNACVGICPVKAIKTQADEEGFLYPAIDAGLCLECGRCRAVCPVNRDGKEKDARGRRIYVRTDYERKENAYAGYPPEGDEKKNDRKDTDFGGDEPEKTCGKDDEENAYEENNYGRKVYAVKHRDEDARLLSTSGGMFTALSDHIIESGGVVYGAAFDKEHTVRHGRAETKEQRDKMRGSKYVQSDIGDVFLQVRKDLSEGKPVLFTGTPCQAAGLQNYLGKTDTSGLILCDILCHGVASPLMWREYLHFLERRKRTALKQHYFRSKIYGWHRMTSKNVFQNGKEDAASSLSQIHMRLFLSDLILRPCCHTCGFASPERCTDITIADFWGVERTMPEFDDNRGVSLVLTNTRKGAGLFDSVRECLEVRESSLSDCLQHNLEQPTLRPALREQFWKDYFSQGYGFIAGKYAGYTPCRRIRQAAAEYVKSRKLIAPFRRLLRRRR
jgi:coenzyme F420-reducing hydrogenase beta subunit